MAAPSADALPAILEIKRTLDGREKRFDCRARSMATAAPGGRAVRRRRRPMHVHGIDLPAGTVTFGHFWTDRPYNVYHWLDRARQTLGFYFNLADRTVIEAERLEWRDLTVDVLAMPAGRLDVLDEDELPAELDATTRARIDAGKAADPGATGAP